MAKFRCKRSGNCVSFTNEDDIRGLRVHEGYEEVFDTPVEKPVEREVIHEEVKSTSSEASKQAVSTEAKVLKQRGRPKKK